MNPSPLRPLAGGWGLSGGGTSVPVAAVRLAGTASRAGEQESYMTSSHISSPPIERQILNVGILRAGVLAMIALIAGSMFAYDLVLSSRTPLPRPRPGAVSAAPALLANPVGQLLSNHSAAPVNTECGDPASRPASSPEAFATLREPAATL